MMDDCLKIECWREKIVVIACENVSALQFVKKSGKVLEDESSEGNTCSQKILGHPCCCLRHVRRSDEMVVRLLLCCGWLLRCGGVEPLFSVKPSPVQRCCTPLAVWVGFCGGPAKVVLWGWTTAGVFKNNVACAHTLRHSHLARPGACQGTPHFAGRNSPGRRMTGRGSQTLKPYLGE